MEDFWVQVKIKFFETLCGCWGLNHDIIYSYSMIQTQYLRISDNLNLARVSNFLDNFWNLYETAWDLATKPDTSKKYMSHDTSCYSEFINNAMWVVFDSWYLDPAVSLKFTNNWFNCDYYCFLKKNMIMKLHCTLIVWEMFF